MKKYSIIKLCFLGITFAFVSTSAQSKWYANTSMQMVGSEFQDGSKHNSFFLYNGLRYQTQDFYLSLSIPIVLGSDNTFTQLGNSYSPNDNGDHMGGSGSMSSINVGIGDLYLNGSLSLLKETTIIPNFSIDGYLKFPTATPSFGIGTGEFDSQIALGIRKFINSFSFFGQFGYLFLGDVAGVEASAPYTISLGVGYAFGYGKHSVLLAYDSYTTIVQGVASPQQLALGYNYMLSKGLFFTAIISTGLNSSTSDYTISGGLNYEI